MLATSRLSSKLSGNIRYSFTNVGFWRSCTTGTFLQYEKDPAPYFLNPEVQRLLKSVTRVQFEKIFRKRSVPFNRQDISFMTIEAFEKEVEHSFRKAKRMLQMPPIVKIREDNPAVLSKDSSIDGFSESKFVFTDISFDNTDGERLIVVRQPDGTLEHASINTRKRMNQIYFPIEGRYHVTPPMFQGEFLQSVLDRHEYEFLFDRLVVQFDPHEREYHEISSKAYAHINASKEFDKLRSTRHFGPMAFFFAWHRMIDDLLVDCIKRDYLRDGVKLILLYFNLHEIPEAQGVREKLVEFPKTESIVQEYVNSQLKANEDDIHQIIRKTVGKSDKDFVSDEAFLAIIDAFTKNQATKKVQLELATQTFREELGRKRQLNESLQKQHGILCN